MESNLIRPYQKSLDIRDNHEPVKLKWEGEWKFPGDEMPVLRANWIELQVDYMVYWTECEIEQRKYEVKKWANLYTNM